MIKMLDSLGLLWMVYCCDYSLFVKSDVSASPSLIFFSFNQHYIWNKTPTDFSPKMLQPGEPQFRDDNPW